MKETSIINSKAQESFNKNFSELTNDIGLKAPYLASSLFNLFTPENKSQFAFLEDPNSIRMNNFLINECIPVTLFSKISTLSDTKNSFKLDRDFLRTMTNYIFNVGLPNPQDQKLIYEFEEEVKLDIER